MAAYLVVDTLLNDPDLYEQYKVQARPLIEKFGGQYLARGGRMTLRETDLWSPSRLVLVKFSALKPRNIVPTRLNISKSFPSARNPHAEPRLFWKVSNHSSSGRHQRGANNLRH
jgi:uncharacterized protein (DUF1330 family)